MACLETFWGAKYYHHLDMGSKAKNCFCRSCVGIEVCFSFLEINYIQTIVMPNILRKSFLFLNVSLLPSFLIFKTFF